MDAYTTALTLLSRRELSTAQLRARLARRKFDAAEIDSVIQRLVADGTLDDRRVAVAAARLEGALRHRGRRRVVQRLQQLGVSRAVADAATDEVFSELDETALLDRAIEKRLKGASPRDLDAKGVARLIRGLVGQGFEVAEIYRRLRSRGARDAGDR
jgi:regulatory protein